MTSIRRGRSVSILGTRGVPARHGGFETFAARLALHLAGRGWRVSVYCQAAGRGVLEVDDWKGVRRVVIPVDTAGALGTAIFDWRSMRHAVGEREPLLVLGYNTAVFCLLSKLSRVPAVMNMDGIEWKRAKWPAPLRAWFFANEYCGAWLCDHLIADNPAIETHLARHTAKDRITMIPYGADTLEAADPAPLAALGLEPSRFATVIARAEPENSILEIVAAFSRARRGLRLVVLGNYDASASGYHRRVLAAASDEVIFAGAIYDAHTLAALRVHSRLYVHGHRVGGTNPSLVEALGARNPVLAHDNHFNRWVAGPHARYFSGTDGCAREFDRLLDDAAALAAMSAASRARHEEAFTWGAVLPQYERLLERYASERQPNEAPTGAPASVPQEGNDERAP